MFLPENVKTPFFLKPYMEQDDNDCGRSQWVSGVVVLEYRK